MRGVDVGHFETDLMLPAERVLREEPVDRRVRAERLDQLDLRVRCINETHSHPLRGEVERFVDRGCTHNITPMHDAVGD